MPIAVYIRVSSKDQHLEGQRREVESYLALHGLAGAIWYEDKESARARARPGLAALQTAIARGRVDTVIVWKLDRLARSMREGVKLLHDWLDRGVRIVAVTQPFDLSGLVGQMIAGLLFAIAEMELQTLHERQAPGIAEAKARGAFTGRKPGTFKADRQRAKMLRASGWKQSEIARALGVSISTIRRYLAA